MKIVVKLPESCRCFQTIAHVQPCVQLVDDCLRTKNIIADGQVAFERIGELNPAVLFSK